MASQHGEGMTCRNTPRAKECTICCADDFESITCDCGAPTGTTHKGILGIELVQVHPTNKCLTDFVGAIKRCGCVAHVRLHLLCSSECKKASIFKDLPLGNVRREEGLIIGETGPLMIVQQIIAEAEPSSEEPTRCAADT